MRDEGKIGPISWLVLTLSVLLLGAVGALIFNQTKQGEIEYRVRVHFGSEVVTYEPVKRMYTGTRGVYVAPDGTVIDAQKAPYTETPLK